MNSQQLNARRCPNNRTEREINGFISIFHTILSIMMLNNCTLFLNLGQTIPSPRLKPQSMCPADEIMNCSKVTKLGRYPRVKRMF